VKTGSAPEAPLVKPRPKLNSLSKSSVSVGKESPEPNNSASGSPIGSPSNSPSQVTRSVMASGSTGKHHTIRLLKLVTTN